MAKVVDYVVDFESVEAELAVMNWERKNKTSIMTLYNPNMPSVVELIKIGSGAKTDFEAVNVLHPLMKGRNIRLVSNDLMRASARFTPVGNEGIEELITKVDNDVADGMTLMLTGGVVPTAPTSSPVDYTPVQVVLPEETEDDGEL